MVNLATVTIPHANGDPLPEDVSRMSCGDLRSMPDQHARSALAFEYGIGHCDHVVQGSHSDDQQYVGKLFSSELSGRLP
jgi:hypothetical protein